MTATVYGTCYGCGADVPDAPGVAYCDACVAGQLEAEREERAAFDAYHRFADAIARRETGACRGCPNAHACQYGAVCRWPADA